MKTYFEYKEGYKLETINLIGKLHHYNNKKVTFEVHACGVYLRVITNVTYDDGP